MTTPCNNRLGQTCAVIYGAGGHASELRYEMEKENIYVVAFVDDFSSGHIVEGVPVLTFEEASNKYKECHWFIAVGDPSSRRVLSKKVAGAALPVGRFISSGAHILPTTVIGDGAQVFHGAVISANVRIGDFVIINFGSVISHDVKIGSFSTVSPGVHVAGNVSIGEGVWLGVGSSIRNGSAAKPLTVGDWSVVGAGACVISEVENNLVVVGVPARPIKG